MPDAIQIQWWSAPLSSADQMVVLGLEPRSVNSVIQTPRCTGTAVVCHLMQPPSLPNVLFRAACSDHVIAYHQNIGCLASPKVLCHSSKGEEFLEVHWNWRENDWQNRDLEVHHTTLGRAVAEIGSLAGLISPAGSADQYLVAVILPTRCASIYVNFRAD